MNSMEEIYKEHAKTVYKYLLVQTNSIDLAEELTQETFFRAVNSVKNYKEKSNISTWLCGIAKNVWYEYLRKNKKQDNLDEVAEQVLKSSPETEFFVEWDNMNILKKLHNLKEPMREVMYLRLIGNLSFRQIGGIMDKTENWARVTYYRGKEKMVKEAEHNE